MEVRKLIQLELNLEMWDLLTALAKGKAASDTGDPKAVVELLLKLASDGIKRPRSWERQWIETAFGDDWQEHLEQDPKAYWLQRPKVRST